MSTGPATRWLFDLGNSRLKCAPLSDGRLGQTLFVEHDGKTFAPGWDAALPERIAAASVASVAGAALTQTLLAALAARSDALDVALTLPDCAGVRIAYAQPQHLGVDRFLSLLAARERSPEPTLIVGVGTALTIDLLGGDGMHRGGRIAPSPRFMRAMLHARAPQLPADGGDYTEFAADTADALAAGCTGAALGLVERSSRAAQALLGSAPGLLLHGGGAGVLHAHLSGAVLAPALVLEGLAQWARCHD